MAFSLRPLWRSNGQTQAQSRVLEACNGMIWCTCTLWSQRARRLALSRLLVSRWERPRPPPPALWPQCPPPRPRPSGGLAVCSLRRPLGAPSVNGAEVALGFPVCGAAVPSSPCPSHVWPCRGFCPFLQVVDTSKGVADVPEWFRGSRLNYAENLLRHKDPDKAALYVASESRRPPRRPALLSPVGTLRQHPAPLLSRVLVENVSR